uniref:Saposin B-type domain-containing protein n=1 Tax=Strongyloides papillosus TaxID=174720 RepID=A0A0N5CA93_STREA
MKFLVIFLLILKILLTFEESIACNTCISVVDEIAKKLLDLDKAKIINELSNICDRTTFGNQALDSACKDYVVREINIIAQKIKKLEDSQMVCSKLHFC